MSDVFSEQTSFYFSFCVYIRLVSCITSVYLFVTYIVKLSNFICDAFLYTVERLVRDFVMLF